MTAFRRRVAALSGSLLMGLVTGAAAAPTVEEALQLKPIQRDVEFDVPGADDLKHCTIKGEKLGEHSAWVVRDPAGEVLRQFVDTNADNTVDLWCYYRSGIEVYRDIDANFNGKADQYRWLNTGGSRWGLDDNEDGKIEQWKAISAEEVTAEAVRALAEQDQARFQRLLLSDDELKSLGLGPDKAKELAEKLKKARNEFAAAAKNLRGLSPQTNWVHFGGTRPGSVPAGTEGSTRDLLVYENAVAMTETAGKHGQVHIGTLVQVGNVWRLVDLPQVDERGELVDTGFFFKAAPAARPAAGAAPVPESKAHQLLVELEALDRAGAAATKPADQARYVAQRADLLEKLAAETEDRGQWLRHLADSLSAAAQSGLYPEGVDRLKNLAAKLADEKESVELAAYVKFRYLTADYGRSLQEPNPDFQKIQARWLENLEQYVADYPDSPDAAEAMMQLGVAQEFAGQEEAAKEWYGKVAGKFPNSPSAKKAAGAITRLESVGKPIRLAGKSTAGGTVDLANYKGKLVLIHYWATWCEPCVADLETIKSLYTRYASAGFAPIGVNLDSNQKDAEAFLQKNRLPWPQIYEPGSLDGRLANELGILTLPTMILVDKQGRVISRNITSGELEAELKKQFAAASASTPARSAK